MYDILLFDLDGTLTDPGEGITNSVAYALNKFGITVEDKKELYKQSKLKLPMLLVEEIGEKNAFDIEKRTNDLADSLYKIISEISK